MLPEGAIFVGVVDGLVYGLYLTGEVGPLGCGQNFGAFGSNPEVGVIAFGGLDLTVRLVVVYFNEPASSDIGIGLVGLLGYVNSVCLLGCFR